MKPLAEQLRPDTLENFVGQSHLVGVGMPIQRFLEKKHIQSMIFWGPPGTGKTTLARILSRELQMTFLDISATESGAKELKAIVAKAKAVGSLLLFIDEIHRFNKLQQDILLPHVEKGILILIGSTTENPSFSVNKAILSRCLVMPFYPIDAEDILRGLKIGCQHLEHSLDAGVLKKISFLAQGDMRRAYNLMEATLAAGENAFTEFSENPIYDRLSDEHYNHASALQKSIRGSDPDAAIYWLAKMIAAGEDPEFIARRILVCAAEDIGEADTTGTLLAMDALRAVQQLGLPEARIHLAQAVIHLARAPKSNETICSIDAALADIRNGKSYPVPKHLQDSHYASAGKIAGVHGYIYSHDAPFDTQTFLPKELENRKYVKASELNHLPDTVRQKILQQLSSQQGKQLNIAYLSSCLNMPPWKLKKALRFLIRAGKLQVNADMSFEVLKSD